MAAYTYSILLLFTFVYVTFQKEVPEEFQDVLNKEPKVAALFTKTCCACTECVEAEAFLAVLQSLLLEEFQLVLVKLTEQPSIEKEYGIKDHPSLVFLRNKQPALYSGPFEKEAVFEWFSQSQEVALKKLDDNTFEHLTQASTGATTGDWLVAFHDASCGGLPLHNVLDGLAVKVKGRVLVATVDIESSPNLKERFNIVKCPTLIFFRQGKMYLYDLAGLSISSLKPFVEGFYKNAKASPVPIPKSPFEKLTDQVVIKLKENPMMGLMVAGGFLLFIFTLYGISEKKDPKRKKN